MPPSRWAPQPSLRDVHSRSPESPAIYDPADGGLTATIHPPMQPPSTRRELLSVDDYAARTGISPTEIRRQIRAGTLPAETFQRPQGTYYRVIVDTPEDTPAPAEPIESVQTPSTVQEPPGLTMRTLDIMDALLRANAETLERQAETIANLRERAGRAEERAESLGIQAAALRLDLERAHAELADERLDRARRWWRFWR